MSTKNPANQDPITGAPGAHPVGTGVGASGGGGYRGCSGDRCGRPDRHDHRCGCRRNRRRLGGHMTTLARLIGSVWRGGHVMRAHLVPMRDSWRMSGAKQKDHRASHGGRRAEQVRQLGAALKELSPGTSTETGSRLSPRVRQAFAHTPKALLSALQSTGAGD